MSSAVPPPYSVLASDVPPPYTADPETEEHSGGQSGSVDVVGTGYAPAPASLNQEEDEETFMPEFAYYPRIADHFILTIISMVVCGLLLNLCAFICLIPAFKLSKKALKAKEQRRYMEARSKGQWSLWLNVAALISYIILMMFSIIVMLIIILG